MACKKVANMKNCTCSFNCGSKGVCCDCVSYHRNKGEIPGCFFPKDAEKTGNRSIENFINVMSR